MIECKEYTAPELWKYFGVRNNSGLEEKMTDTYKIGYTKTGWGKNTRYTITAIPNPFKVFCVFDLGFSPQTNFCKLRDFLFYLFNDEDFNGKPFEMMEAYLRIEGHSMSRQTIANYVQRLQDLDLIGKWGDYVYYRVYKHYGVQEHTVITKEEYNAAWRDYFDYRAANPDATSRQA